MAIINEENIRKILSKVENNGMGDEFPLFSFYTVAAEEWPNEEGCGSYFQYYILWSGDIEWTGTSRTEFINRIKRLV